MVQKKCCVETCNDMTSTRHRFPIDDDEIFQTWVQHINHSKFSTLTKKQIYDNYVICDKHFTDDCKLRSKKLRKKVVPTLFLTGLNETSSQTTLDLKEETPNEVNGVDEPVIALGLNVKWEVNTEDCKQKLNKYKKEDLCRTCLSSENLTSLFTCYIQETEVASILSYCAALEITKNDDLPDKICSQCVTFLNQIYLFRQQCEKIDNLLRTYEPPEQKDKDLMVKPEIVYDDCFDDQYSDNESSSEENKSQNRTKKCKIKSDIKKKPNLKKCKDCLENNVEECVHVKTKKKVRHTCIICGVEMWAYQLKVHMVQVHQNEKPYQCDMCDKRFIYPHSLERHKVTHNVGKLKHKCEICQKNFARTEHLKSHLITHSEERPYVCEHCGKSFKRPRGLEDHREYTHNQKSKRAYKCNICNRSYCSRASLSVHMNTHEERKEFLCNYCGKGFPRKVNLDSHLVVHTKERLFSCNTCGKRFARKAAQQIHSRIHTGDRLSVCIICGRKFTTKSRLKLHIKTHTGEKPFACTYCDKPFADKHNLKVHIRIHTGETPYECPECGMRFREVGALKKHRQDHAGNIFILP